MRRFLLVVPVLALAASLLAAQPSASTETRTFTVDNVHSTVLFRINHLGTSFVYGRFNELKGQFTLSGGATNPLAVEMEVKAETVDTNAPPRDKHLRSPDFFNVKEHPTITFKSTGSKMVSAGKYQVTGDLTLLGVTKPLTAELDLFGPVESPKGTRSGFETTFTIKRSDFGMNFMQGPTGLGDEVRLTVSTEGSTKKE